MNPTAGSAMIYQASTWVLPVVFAVTFHEAAHGFVAYRFGDDTARRAGRMTLNPLKHVDPFGTVLLPALLYMASGFLFGYAKPVPVNFGALHNPRRDMIWVALAGPGMNVLLAVVSAALFYGVALLPGGRELFAAGLSALLRGQVLIPYNAAGWLAMNIGNAIAINAILCVFNLLPVPPLDGGRVAVGILPRSLAYPLARLEPYGIFIVLGVLFVLPWLGVHTGLSLNVLPWVIGVPAEALFRFVLWITGQGG